MVEATVKYKKDQCDLSFPSSWNELTEKQLLYIAEYYESWRDLSLIGDTMRKARALLMLELCGIESRREKRKLCRILSHVDDRVDINLLDCTDFVFEKLNLTKNIIPSIKVGWFTRYNGPADFLDDVTIEEFSFAFSSYIKYLRTGNEEHLTDLISILYRPVPEDFKTSGKRRVPFNLDIVNVNHKRMSRVKYKYKHAVYLYFRGCVEAFGKKYPFVFKRAEKNEAGNAGTFFDTIVDISGGKFGALESTKNTPVHIILKQLNKDIIEYKNRKKK